MTGSQPTRAEIDQLIVDLGLGFRDPSGMDLEEIRLHVRRAGFDPRATFPADRRVLGLQRANGRIVRPSDQIPTAEIHYLRHVVRQQEWPAGTTQTQYERSLRNLATRLRVGILVSDIPPFGWHVGIVGRSGDARGPVGANWMLVEYRVNAGHWATGYQLRDGLTFANARRRKRWLRLPT